MTVFDVLGTVLGTIIGGAEKKMHEGREDFNEGFNDYSKRAERYDDDRLIREYKSSGHSMKDLGRRAAAAEELKNRGYTKGDLE